jgi:4-alpha-glucanotransferase
MTWPRRAGVLLHPTSLPGPHGIGDLGADAHRWLDTLAAAGLGVWQLLPLGPTGYGDSPYQVFSAFAGNPLLLAVDGDGDPTLPVHRVDFARVLAHKRPLIARAAQAALHDTTRREAFDAFRDASRDWLPDFALFMALKDAHGGAPWHAWPREYALRDASALANASRRLAGSIARIEAEQFLFATQWRVLREAAAARGVQLMGDVPIYVAHDNADVWTHRHLFRLHPDGRLRVQAGVPPDYFSATGQLWGNPLYDWEAVRADGYAWWIARLRAAFAQFDIVRLDHFRGFAAYWEVAGDATTAAEGQWQPGPGAAFFDAVHAALGPVPIVAENLGVITPDVEALRAHGGYPGMCVLQFAFAPGEGALRPYAFPTHAVAYTGTHDNDTIVGWWSGADASTQDAAAAAAERVFAARYLDVRDAPKHWAMIRAAFASACHTAIVPWQDVLGLGSSARMNQPGRAAGNWAFRFAWDDVPDDAVARLRELATMYDRQRRDPASDVVAAMP